MSYPEPRRIEITWSDIRGLTVLEAARACALAGVSPADAERLIAAYALAQLEPAEVLTAATLLYAIVLQLERRNDPAATWEAVQLLQVALNAEDPDRLEELATAEARAEVEAAIATGLPPHEAGQLTMRQVGAYREVAAAAREGSR